MKLKKIESNNFYINIFEVVWMAVFKLLHLKSSRKATGGFEKKKEEGGRCRIGPI